MAGICDPITVPHEEEELVGILEETISTGKASLVGPDGQRHRIPAEVRSLFVQVLKALREGKAVSIMPYTRQLTTQQAARILGVSRRFLVGLHGEISIGARWEAFGRELRASIDGGRHLPRQP